MQSGGRSGETSCGWIGHRPSLRREGGVGLGHDARQRGAGLHLVPEFGGQRLMAFGQEQHAPSLRQKKTAR
jgi:hypothetical protein